MDEPLVNFLLNGSKNNLPEQTCFVHFTVSCWRYHISQFCDENVKLISPLFLTQVPRPSFGVFFFREVIHFDVKIVIFLILETQVLLPCFSTRKTDDESFRKRNYFFTRLCFNPPPMPYLGMLCNHQY